jgi:hypothetical protein
MNPLLLALAISLAANALLGWAYLGQRDTATTAVVQQEQATGAAQACSQGTESLLTEAAENARQGAPKRAAAAQAAEIHDKRADEILATPAAVPGDDCKSAQAQVDLWWKGRQ